MMAMEGVAEIQHTVWVVVIINIRPAELLAFVQTLIIPIIR